MTVKVSSLNNGLRIVTDTMKEVDSIFVGVWVGVGARNESEDINGVAHFLEHMAFKGTTTRNAKSIAEEIEKVGGFVNACTSRETTAYHIKVLKEDISLAVEILADILQDSIFDKVELERERGVILQEIGRSYDTPDDVIFDYFQHQAFPAQPMGRPILGTIDLIKNMPRQKIVDYMNSNYVAPRIIISAAGNIDHKYFFDLASKQFSRFPENNISNPEPANYSGGKFIKKKDLEQIHVVYGFKGTPYGHALHYPFMVFSSILGGGMSSRLFQEVREKRGLAYSIYSFKSTYQDSGLFGIYSGTGKDKLKELLPVIRDEIIALENNVTEEEIMKSKAQIKSSILMSMENNSSRCEKVAQQLLVYGEPISTADIVNKVESVEKDDISKIVRFLMKEKPTLAIVGPVESSLSVPGII